MIRASRILSAFIVLITMTALSRAANQTWDPLQTGTGSDGSGSWNTTNSLWSTGTDVPYVNDGTTTAIFGKGTGAAGTVMIDDPSLTINAAGITFAVPGSGSYTIGAVAGTTLTLIGTTSSTIAVPTSVTATINAPIIGAFGSAIAATTNGLIIGGGGTLTLNGANNYTGSTQLQNNTTINVGNGAVIGNTGGIVNVGFIPNGSAVDTTAILNLNNGASLNASTLNVFFNNNTAFTASAVTGPTLNVNGAATINANTIAIDAGRGSGNTKGGDGTLKLNPGSTLTLHGSNGTDPVNLLDIAHYNYETGGGTSAGILGTVDFSAGTVNGTINTIVVGTGKGGTNANSTGTATGRFLFANGSLSAGAINLGVGGTQPGSGTISLAAGGTGTLTAGSITYGANTSVAGGGPSTGTINLNGATLAMTGDINSNNNASANTVLNLNGGTLDMGTHSIGSSNSITVTLTQGTLKNLGGSGINNAGLTMNGAGTVTLDGTNSYTGNTTISSGTLSVIGSITGGGTLNANAGTLAGKGDGTTTGLLGSLSVAGGTVHPGTAALDVATLTMSTLVFHTGTLAIDLGPSFTSDLLNNTGALTLGDTSSSALSLTVAGAPVVGNYDIINYAAGSLTRNADFAISGPVGFTYALDYSHDGQVFLNVSASNNFLTWSGANDHNTWDTAHANFNNGSTNVAYSDPTPVLFNDSAPANSTTVNIATTVSPSSVTVNSTTNNYTFQGAGAISGNATLTKDGDSTLTLVNNNSYTGATTITKGTIQVGNGGTTGSIGSGPVSVTGTLAYNRSDSVTVANSISGSGTLQQIGPGTLILSGANSYGATLISGGTLQIDNNGTTGTLGTGPVTNNGTLAFARSDNTTVSNAISGNGGIVSMGASVLTLSGGNTFTGPVTVAAGSTLKVTDSSSLGATTGTLGNITIAAGATLDAGTNIDTLNFGSRVFHIQGTGANNAGALNNSTTSLQLNIFNFITLDADATVAGSRMDIGASNSGAVLNLNGHTLTTSMTTSSNRLFGIAGGSVTAGQIVVSSGALNINSAASVLADGQGSVITYNSGTTAQFQQTTTAGNITRPLVFLGNNTLGNGAAAAVTINSNISLQGNLAIVGLNGGAQNTTGVNPITLAGNISDDSATSATPRSISKIGSATATLSGNNTFTGGVTVTGGTFTIGNGHALGIGPFSITGGTASTTAGFTSAIHVSGLNIGTKLDLNDNDLIVDYTPGNSPGATIRGYLANGYAGGAWNGGSGITSVAAANDTTKLKALGYADAADVGLTSDDGVAITGPAVVVRYTYYGDSSLDGKVDLGNDFNLFLQGFLDPTLLTDSNKWSLGDYNYDNNVDMTDFGMFIDGFAGQGGPLGELADVISAGPQLSIAQKAAFLAAVPEPASAAILAIAGAVTLSTRKRR